MKISFLIPLVSLVCSSVLVAQDKTSPQDAIDKFNEAFEASYAKGDVPGLLEVLTDDAQITSDDGNQFAGKEAISDALKGVFAADPGIKLQLDTESVRQLAPGVVAGSGVSTTTAKDGDINSVLFTAIYVQKDGKWKISEFIESPLPGGSAADHLAQLNWLIGKWEETDPANNVSVTSEYNHARGDNFITRNVQVKRDGQPALEGWQVIGWDPVEGKIRSWTFDSEGGFSDGYWTGEGNRWLVREVGYAPDGTRNSADVTINKVNADRFTWESNNRTLDGEPQPSIDRIEIARVKEN